MNSARHIARSLGAGAVLGAAPGLLGAATLRCLNPRFLDRPLLFGALFLLLPALLGALIGWRWRAPTISADNVGGNSRRLFLRGKTDSSPPIRGGHRLSPPSSPLDERRRAAQAAQKRRRGSSSNCRQDRRLFFGARWRLRAPWAAWVLAAMLLVYGGLASWPAPQLKQLRLLVVGLDGASFQVIDPLLAAGQLPALGELQAQGARADLRSMEPMHSPLLWTTIATGKTPQQHGVAGFRVQAGACRVPRFWDVAEAQGLRVGIYKWLVTYPPRELRGFMVPGWLASGPETFPAELSFVKELELGQRLRREKIEGSSGPLGLAARGIPRGLRFGTLLEAACWLARDKLGQPSRDERMVALQRLRGRIDLDVFLWALAEYEPDVASFGFYATDALAHHFWRHHEPQAFQGAADARYAEVVRDAYRQGDAILGELRAAVGSGCTTVLLSDHGFRALDVERGSAFFAPLTERLQERLSADLGSLEVLRLGAKLSVTLLEEGQRRGELEELLDGLRDEDGERFFRHEPLPGHARALGLTIAAPRLSPERIAQDTVGGEPMADYVRLSQAYSGEHAPLGVFLAAGPGIPAGRDLGELELRDVSPTLQALLGIPPARDLPGRVVLGDPARGPATRDELVLEQRFLDGQQGVNEEGLRELGYVD